jgi:hypothetical protein
MNELIEIKCPYMTKDKNGSEHPCSQICGKFKPGSSGEVYCRRHNKVFDFEVTLQNKPVEVAHVTDT